MRFRISFLTALFGKNDAPEEQLTKVVFDQQLTRMYATG